ncbi:MAG: glycolate oxidase subunit GlcE [Gammaproteobacteria bacterium]|nr:glycolate oxidase subunit GlcE [Gammaproteobacteria bacterium]
MTDTLESTDQTIVLQNQVKAALVNKAPLVIQGGGSKPFYGRAIEGTPLSTSGHKGILRHQPTELVITARAGTLLSEIETRLAEHHQMLPFEPPYFGKHATLGGAIACGLSGPRRPWSGAVRDMVLGCRILNGSGEILHFGGEVMKNVAGYDVSRLMSGALGTLGLLLDISLKVQPKPAFERTLSFSTSAAESLIKFNQWRASLLPLSAAIHYEDAIYLRLSGHQAAVEQACSQLGGTAEEGTTCWTAIREHKHTFFDQEAPLWRLSVPPATPCLDLGGSTLIDWAGAQRWLQSDAPAAHIRDAVDRVGGHATLFRGGDRLGEVFHPPSKGIWQLHQRVKKAFDPSGIFNPGRLYPAL